ncbi:MAG: hypothetical protein CSA81_04720 [Acidobacteria bacterium]|nr:MAG: hypothetical protein CSA81_04720 [Acidobacteriota bacterium]
MRPHTLNLYEYCANDPVNVWGPTGEQYAYDEEKEQRYIEYKDDEGETNRHYLTAEQSAKWNDWIQGKKTIGEGTFNF